MLSANDEERIKKLEERISFLEEESNIAPPQAEKWYENIPDGGVLCWVRNFDDQQWSKFPNLVIAYMEGTHPFSSTGLWKQAKPLSKQEIQVFIGNVPE